MPDPIDAAADIAALGISWKTLEQLALPTPPEEVRTRPDRAIGDHRQACEGPRCQVQRDPNFHVQLAYVDARFVMRRLDAVCGPHWQRDHRAIGERVACGIGILVDGTWLWRWDGAGETDIEGEKGAFSDSFKRAAVSWGIARDLYGTGHTAPTAAVVSPPAVPSQPVQQPVAATAPATPAAGYPDADSVCPVHGARWILKPGGVSKATGKPYNAFWACPSTARPFCKEHPSQAWVAAQETAA